MDYTSVTWDILLLAAQVCTLSRWWKYNIRKFEQRDLRAEHKLVEKCLIIILPGIVVAWNPASLRYVFHL